jgi:hypothetical protein
MMKPWKVLTLTSGPATPLSTPVVTPDIQTFKMS